MNWGKLKEDVENCLFSDCPRNKDTEEFSRLPILFEREDDTLSKIKFVVVSQDPGVGLRRNHSNSDEIKDDLTKECNEKDKPKGVPRRIRKIFGDDFNHNTFNPKTSQIYWTHALKCVPIVCDAEIECYWEDAAQCCVEHFKKELELISKESTKELTIITLGARALALCRHVLEDESLKPPKINEYIENVDPERKINFGGKEIFLFPFIHSARGKRGDVVKEREKEFIEKIQEHYNS